MKLEDIIKLIDAGYTKADIEAMNAPEETPAEETPAAEPEAEKAPAVDLSGIQKDIADLKKGLYALNIMNSTQPEKKTADDVLMAALGGGKESK